MTLQPHSPMPAVKCCLCRLLLTVMHSGERTCPFKGGLSEVEAVMKRFDAAESLVKMFVAM